MVIWVAFPQVIDQYTCIVSCDPPITSYHDSYLLTIQLCSVPHPPPVQLCSVPHPPPVQPTAACNHHCPVKV